MAFSVCDETDEQKKLQYVGRLIKEPFGYFYLDETLTRQPIEMNGIDMKKPLFYKYDEIVLKRGDIENLKEDTVKTTVGRLLLNALAIVPAFKDKIPYINTSKFSPSDVENIFAKNLQDAVKNEADKKPGMFYVDEKLLFDKAVGFIENLSRLFARSITEKGLVPAPGKDKFIKDTLAKYEGKLTDPVEMVKFQTELADYDKKYLEEEDPTYDLFMSGKKILGARSRSFMTQGGETNAFTNSLKMVPIIQPLTDGIDLHPEQFSAVSNTIRYGSFSRGLETVNGGVAAKALMTALDTWMIDSHDCGVPYGVHRTYQEDEIYKVINRYVLLNGKPTLIPSMEEAKALIGKEIIIRSPQYCRKKKTHTCAICAGVDLSKFENGLVIPAMETSSGIMSDSLKKMHDTTASSNRMVLSKVVT